MSSKTEQVHTTIHSDLHYKALLNKLSWSECLELGLKIRLEYQETEEAKLMEDKKHLENEINILKGRLRMIEEKLRKIQSEREKESEEDSDIMTKAIKMNNPFRYKQ